MSVTLIAESPLLLLAGAGIAYLAWAIWCVWRFRPGGEAHPSYRPALTILKPLCGADPDLLDCLRSFCRQDYPGLQIVFGVADPADPALPIVRRMMAEFPARDIAIVVDPTLHGANRKVSNLINMMPLAKHGILIVCDGDVRVPDNCLGALVGPLADPTVGAVTAPIRGVVGRGLGGHGFAARLGAAFINDWYFPAALVAERLGPIRSCLGPLTVVRRDSLEAIGGFAALADQIADDFMLGQLISQRGDRVLISRTAIDVMVHEDFASLARRELRWARTIRATEPMGHWWSMVTHVLPIVAAPLLVSPSRVAVALLLLHTALRVVLNRLICARLGIAASPPWFILLREAACLAIWMFSYANRRIEWRGAKFVVVPGGGMRAETAPSAAEPTSTGGQQGARVRRAVLLASVGLTAVLFLLHYELAAIGSALGAVGDTLRQRVHEVRSRLNHRSPPSTAGEKYTHQAHKVALTEGGFFERLAGAREIEVLQSQYGATLSDGALGWLRAVDPHRVSRDTPRHLREGSACGAGLCSDLSRGVAGVRILLPWNEQRPCRRHRRTAALDPERTLGARKPNRVMGCRSFQRWPGVRQPENFRILRRGSIRPSCSSITSS